MLDSSTLVRGSAGIGARVPWALSTLRPSALSTSGCTTMNPEATTAELTTISLPIPWEGLALPEPIQFDRTAVTYGDVGWAWSGNMPNLGVAVCDPSRGEAVAGWDLDHVVVLVPDLDAAVAEFTARTALSPVLRMRVKGRPAAHYRVGPLLEIIESPVRAATLYGIVLVTTEPLEVLALRWRSMGRDVSGPTTALEPGRRILTLRDTEAGLAVMTPTVAVADH